jgi:hypothetical protein
VEEVNDLAAAATVVEEVACLRNRESTLVCLCSRGSPRNLLSVFCLSVGSCASFFLLLRATVVLPLGRDDDEELLVMLFLLMRARTLSADKAVPLACTDAPLCSRTSLGENVVAEVLLTRKQCRLMQRREESMVEMEEEVDRGATEKR